MSDKKSMFEILLEQMNGEESGNSFLNECMKFDISNTKKIPLRHRIIALGFVRKMSLKELNAKLKEAGCMQLYPRDFWEAGLMYAFMNGLSFPEWQKLEEECSNIQGNIKSDYFQENSITIDEIKRYVEDNSDKEQAEMETRHITRKLDMEISKLNSDNKEFVDFMSKNIAFFSPVREKSRYYFCKYLYLYLKGKIEEFVEETKDEFGTDEQFDTITVLKGTTKLKKKKMTAEQKREYMNGAVISPKEIFNAFNYFYFEYISTDWVEIILEYYGDVDSLPIAQKKELAKCLKHYNKSYENLTDDEAISLQLKKMEEDEDRLNEAYSRDSKGKGYQKNRGGENAVRKMIKGSIDIDRTSLISFLLFFGSEARIEDKNKLTINRLQNILEECGFSELNEKNEFDNFIMEYISSSDPKEFLMEEVTRYAFMEQNFFLYQFYLGAFSSAEEYKNMMKK